jgi:hypothetical protein
MKTQKLLGLVFILALLATSSRAVGTPVPLSTGSRPADSQIARHSASDTCPPLSDPTGRIVEVSTEAGLWNAVNENVPNTTILVADGTYNLGQNGYYLWFDTPNVTLRSASGNREAVILDDNYSLSEIVSIIASNVTIADLTIKRAGTHPIHVTSSDSGDTLNTLIYNVHIIDAGQQAIKINPHSAKVHFPDYGEVACSRIELTDAGRPHIWDINGSCYTGGVDAHQARGWTIRDNLIEGFWCENGLSEHGIHLWSGSRDTVVERNVLIDNARGVGFGLMESASGRTYDDNPCPGATGYVGHFDGIIRNNFIFANRDALFSSEYGFDCGICLWQACGAKALHNTVISTDAPFSSIEYRFSNTDVEIINNLVSHNLRDRGGVAFLAGNLEDAPLSLFVDGAGGDLHLAANASSAIDQGEALAGGLCDDDIDGDLRPIGPARDIGADEYGAPPPTAVTDLRVTNAITDTNVLTATLRWTAPTNAVTYTMRYSDTPITGTTWKGALTITVPFTASAPSSTEWLTTPVSYIGGTAYFALKSQNAEEAWSGLSNNGFWPRFDVCLPLVLHAYGP